ncbi:MAG: radical SAM protein, partial [Nitrososphaeria archaeon]
YCNLNCAHCAVNAKLIKKTQNIPFELTSKQIFLIIDQIKDYTSRTGFKPFLDFGGGEPTLRPDLEEILAYASTKLGAQNISLTTNGTTLELEELIRIGKHVGVIEISLDGFETQHNSLRDPKKVTKVDNPFAKTFNLISSALKDGFLKDKIQVASVILKKNAHSLPHLARCLRELGLRNYYILRRAMPVGRMLKLKQEILNAAEYLHLFIQIAEIKKENPEFKIRMHHSLESIYSALFIGEDIYESILPMRSGKHSIGIDWNGYIYFDPWGLVAPFNILNAGNLLRDKNLWDFMNDPQGILRLASEIVKKNVRCKQCKMACTGGMRFNAISHHISQYNIKDITKSHLIAGFSEIDPACPLYG